MNAMRSNFFSDDWARRLQWIAHHSRTFVRARRHNFHTGSSTRRCTWTVLLPPPHGASIFGIFLHNFSQICCCIWCCARFANWIQWDKCEKQCKINDRKLQKNRMENVECFIEILGDLNRIFFLVSFHIFLSFLSFCVFLSNFHEHLKLFFNKKWILTNQNDWNINE